MGRLKINFYHHHHHLQNAWFMREDAKDVSNCDTWGTVYSTAYNKTIYVWYWYNDTKIPYFKRIQNIRNLCLNKNCQVPDTKVHVIRDMECWLLDFSWCGHRRKVDPSLFFELYQMLPWTDLEISALNSLSFRTVAAEFLSFTVDAGFEVSTNVPLHEGSSSDMS